MSCLPLAQQLNVPGRGNTPSRRQVIRPQMGKIYPDERARQRAALPRSLPSAWPRALRSWLKMQQLLQGIYGNGLF